MVWGWRGGGVEGLRRERLSRTVEGWGVLPIFLVLIFLSLEGQ
ncbi:hypothetical protein [Leptolyngbya sp. NK1-12]|nr:hypothetical protein [Leptolyngbya sp. NK1-12]